MTKATSQRKSRVKPLSSAAAPPAARTGLFELPTGHRIYYSDSGGSGPVLFYLYGLACSIAHWKYQLDYFAAADVPPPPRRGRSKPQRYRQVWLDFRGHGQSTPLPDGESLTISAMVADIVALAEHLGIRSATFLGQSMGGSVALQLARDHPTLVHSLVLLGSPVRDPSGSLPMQPVSAWIWRAVVAVQKTAPFLVKYANYMNSLLLQHPALTLPLREVIRINGFNPKLAQTADVEEYISRMLAVDTRLFSALVADLSDFDAVRFAEHITCPVLIIAGAHDAIVPPSESERLLRHLPHGRLEIIPHGSHCPHFDDPKLINALLSEFLAAPGEAPLPAASDR